MPLIEVTAGAPVIPAGTYVADVIGIAPKSMVTRYSKNGDEQDFLEWTWLVHGKNNTEEIRSLTTTQTGPKSRINEYLVALLGADKVSVGAGFDEDDLIGKSAMVGIVLNEDGFSKVDRVMALPQGSAGGAKAAPKAEAAPVAAAPVEAAQDDLPF